MEYFHKFDVIAKGRWIGHPLIKILKSEFSHRNLNYYQEAIQMGVITINNLKVSSDYIIQSNDRIQHLVHFHEPIEINIPIIKVENDLVIVNKPSGIACHPVSGYKYFTITEIIKKKFTINNAEPIVSCINRIDVPVSGIVILALKDAQKYHRQMMGRNVEKYYIALVRGKFKDAIVDMPLNKEENLRTVIDENGKPSKTIFRTLKSGDFSLVECQPITGRSHQIRAHLAYLGFPIVGDVMYGYEELFIKESHTPSKCVSQIKDCHYPEYSHEAVEFVLDNCYGTDNRAYRYQKYAICLHAYKYKIMDKEYVVEYPEWANLAG